MLFNQKKLLIIGAGSIGQRHLRNLIKLGIKDIAVFDINKEKLEQVVKEYKVKVFDSLQLALLKKWDGAFICTPASSHIEIATLVAKNNIPLFIEKPLADNLEQAESFYNLVKEKNLPVMIGYNLSFHPQFKKIKQMLEQRVIGKIWGVRAEFGQYLPDWHPQENYEQGYSAQKKLGGGIILDDIHEINSLYELFGEVSRVFAFAGKVSDLKIDTEDYTEMIFWFKNDIVGNIHMDYLQRDAQRWLKIIGEKGTIHWDLKKHQLKTFSVSNNKWQVDTLGSFDFNQTYIEEIKYFLECIDSKKEPQPDIEQGKQTLEIALAVKKSAEVGKIIRLK